MTSISPDIYQALVIRKALEFYAAHKIKINRAYTPSNMLATATKITGVKFKPRDYLGAIKALTDWIEKERGAE